MGKLADKISKLKGVKGSLFKKKTKKEREEEKKKKKKSLRERAYKK